MIPWARSRSRPTNTGPAQTERSHENFPIGVGLETMPREITHAFGILKQAAARANHALKPEKMTAEKLTVIEQACQEVASGKLNDHFPLVVWQTGSGTQSNMNANEVIANRGNELAGKKLLHPNDDINMSQSSNDTCPHGNAHCRCPRAGGQGPARNRQAGRDVPPPRGRKRGHRQIRTDPSAGRDADQVLAGDLRLAHELEKDKKMIELALPELRELALGGTAVGTGLNAPKGFDVKVAEEVSALTGREFRTAENKFHALTSKDEIVFAHGALKALAADMMKIANDCPLAGLRSARRTR